MEPTFTETGARASEPHATTLAGRAASSGDKLQRLKSIFSASAGNLIEWYDWYVYSAFALYFAHSFFRPATRPRNCSTRPPSSRWAFWRAPSAAG